MKKMMDVVGFGVNAIDQVARLYRIPDADAKVVCPPDRYELFPGGVMGNTLTGIARLGLRTGYIGRIGDDAFGRRLISIAKDDGLDMSACEVVEGGSTAWTWIVVDERGERTITLFPNLLATIDIDFIRRQEGYIASSQLLHLEGSEMALETSIEAAKIAKQHGIPVSFDLDIPATDLVERLGLSDRAGLDEMISLSDYFIPCIAGAKELSQYEDPLKMAEALQREYRNKVVAISHGADGCFVSTEDRSFQSPAFSITPVDGTGSGDAFHAGMVYGLVKGWDIGDTAEFANACGALNTVVMGARSGMTDEKAVLDFITRR